MNYIKFSHNWNNKLNLPVFTTIRKYKSGKYHHYKNLINESFKVLLNQKEITYAKLLEVELKNFFEIPEALIMYDTGLELKKAIEIFEKFGINDSSDVIILTFKRL